MEKALANNCPRTGGLLAMAVIESVVMSVGCHDQWLSCNSMLAMNDYGVTTNLNPTLVVCREAR
ncbi:MAG: hypothetical protein PHU25_12490 [Deltaproteobacteria bacterium]|nr:hypothetical protein [Deltaproteobacteria bacterium]